MKLSNQIKVGIVLFLGAVIVAFAWLLCNKIMNNSIAEINNCGNNRQCFYQAFKDNCSPATIKTSEKTIEGDLIITTAKIAQDSEECSVEIIVDSTQDKFGDGKTHIFTCGRLIQENQRLTANDCKSRDDTTVVSI